MAPGDHPDQQSERQCEQQRGVDAVDDLQQEFGQGGFQRQYVGLKASGRERCVQQNKRRDACGQQGHHHAQHAAGPPSPTA